MTAKEYLKTYQGEKKEADAIEARIMELERKKKRVKAVSHTGVPGSRNRKDLSDAEVAIEELVESYMRVITAYVTKEADILEKLEQMQEAEERTVLMLKYISDKDERTGRTLTWYDIAERMNVSKRTAQYIHGRALQHFPL